MENTTIFFNGREYPAAKTRNVLTAEKLVGRYDEYKINVKHNGLISKLFVKPLNFWLESKYVGSFFYDMDKDKISWFMWSDYDPQYLFIFRRFVDVLNDDDVVFVSVKRGRIIDRYKIKISALRSLLGCGEDKYGLYPVEKLYFTKLQSKVCKGAYAKR